MLQYNILNKIQVNIEIKDNPYKIPPENLFAMAGRKNKNRAFLFVSRVLGKHIPVCPSLSLLSGTVLAMKYFEECCRLPWPGRDEILSGLRSRQAKTCFSLKKPDLPYAALFIGFAETATALGHSVFNSFNTNSFYIHTSRENIVNPEYEIAFIEEHSHAKNHSLFPFNFDIIKSRCPVVLIDDEITTGKTALNLIKTIHKLFPRKNYWVLSLLDWRTDEDIENFHKIEIKLGIEINTVSLISGQIKINLDEKPVNTNCLQNHINHKPENIPVHYLYLDSFYNNIIHKNPENSRYLKHTGRFGIDFRDQAVIEEQSRRTGIYLKQFRKSVKTLCIGTGEFMYLPMKIASHMGDGVLYQSTTLSPIYPYNCKNYGIKNAYEFQNPQDLSITSYLYNIPPGFYDEIFIFFERDVKKEQYDSLIEQLKLTCVKRIFVITFLRENNKSPACLYNGSYLPDDAVFLLKDLSNQIKEQGNMEREKAIQSGVHYSEMLPIEYKPSDKYMEIFNLLIPKYAQENAIASALAAEKIISLKGRNIVLVSLARAGTPAGILFKRYIKYKYNLNLPHYSISIIRGKGIDENAIKYIEQKHKGSHIQFIDGWTGKGTITRELEQACIKYNQEWGSSLDSGMAVIADPGHCVPIFGTRKDLMIPSACLNSTVSGLISRTVHRKDLIYENDFHGVKFYKEFVDSDMSNQFVDMISQYYSGSIFDKIDTIMEKSYVQDSEISWKGMKDIEKIISDFNIQNINFVKPGIGETTRVLLRRIPWKILISPDSNDLEHILQLAGEKNIDIEEYKLSAYQCCGLIRPVKQ
ncbi:Phosphoribosyl transferase, RNA-binding domain-containing [Desulfonema limicola]|uniref:Phosphoribosyl transferase, RNA-binding domain-containing n=1 Tax=Desulfonema limicola TaxID=45656 RepID=A0A975B5J0_9BACT|nr:phosphoribosyltransferase [Desulfonema limicola]QTA79162.1 Phosphoribosyl transferase, RNA-binding domain-containing [Desulfonema limicola]